MSYRNKEFEFESGLFSRYHYLRYVMNIGNISTFFDISELEGV